jgi:hypothetical protein
MTSWHRVFGTTEAQPAPERLLEHLHQAGLPVSGKFRGDEEGWFEVELIPADGGASLFLHCYGAKEEGIRSELNTWAGWLETKENHPERDRLMQHMVSTRQIYTMKGPAAHEEWAIQTCLMICRFLAKETSGIYQIDGQGFYDSAGTLLLAEA